LFVQSVIIHHDVINILPQWIVGYPISWNLNCVLLIDLGVVGWGDVDWIGLAKDRNRWRAVVNSVLNLWVP
jgi:hypothetical protein